SSDLSATRFCCPNIVDSFDRLLPAGTMVGPGRDVSLGFDLGPHTYLVSAVSFSPPIFSIEKTLMNVPESVLRAVCLADPSTTRPKWKRVASPRWIWIFLV